MNSIASKTPSIYQIRHIESGKVYVGSATNPRRRRQEHRSALRKGTHHSPYLQRAWNKHGESAFVFEIIEPVLFVEDLVNREQYWIDTLRAADTKYGFNISPTAGSTIGVKRSAEVRARKSEQTKAQFADPDVRAKVAEQTKAQFADPDARARRAASQKKLWEDPLYRAKMSARQKERFARPDERARMSEQAKAEWRDPEVRAKITDGAKERTEKQWADPEFRAGMVDRAKTRWADPEFRARYPKHHKKREAKE